MDSGETAFAIFVIGLFIGVAGMLLFADIGIDAERLKMVSTFCKTELESVDIDLQGDITVYCTDSSPIVIKRK